MEIHIVDSCIREGRGGGGGRGGSPTGVVLDDALTSDQARSELAASLGVSHVGFVSTKSADDVFDVRFFTATGELQGCGHGTVAVHAVLHSDALGAESTRRQRTGGRTFDVRSAVNDNEVTSWFDLGTVSLARADENVLRKTYIALGLDPAHRSAFDEPVIASPASPRLLLPVPSTDALWAIRPNHELLMEACRSAGLLGCFAYGPITIDDDGKAVASARMFAPAIGVPEDIANANSTGCLAAHLAASGICDRVRVDQGDLLDRPSTIFAKASGTPRGWVTSIGGTAIKRPGPAPTDKAHQGSGVRSNSTHETGSVTTKPTTPVFVVMTR